VYGTPFVTPLVQVYVYAPLAVIVTDLLKQTVFVLVLIEILGTLVFTVTANTLVVTQPSEFVPFTVNDVETDGVTVILWLFDPVNPFTGSQV
jgi:hypothetical protein